MTITMSQIFLFFGVCSFIIFLVAMYFIHHDQTRIRIAKQTLFFGFFQLAAAVCFTRFGLDFVIGQ